MPAVGVAAGAPYLVQALHSTVQVDSPLSGAHQHRNLALAIAAAVELASKHGFPVTPSAIAEGIRTTHWPARLERIQRDGVEWILDVAHNPAGAWALRAGLRAASDQEPCRVLVFSCLRDKPVAEMAQILFPLFETVIIAPIHSARAAALGDLMAAAQSTGTPAIAAESVPQALQLARQHQPQHHSRCGQVVVSGSVYLVGEARTLLLGGDPPGARGGKT
jgi:dihydrofolate synthase/folylpolyglutamate synthase